MVETAAHDLDLLYQSYLNALLTGDRFEAQEIFQASLDSEPDLKQFYDGLVRRSLYRVGELWERGRVSVATEHIATAITESLLNLVYPRLFSRPRSSRLALVACVANEYHQIGGKIAADLFEYHGWQSLFLGANVPVGDLVKLVTERRPQVVALSVTVSFGLDRAVEAVDALRSVDQDVPILVGGQALRWGGQEAFSGKQRVSCLPGLSELEVWIAGH